jgi:hypothetical protein
MSGDPAIASIEQLVHGWRLRKRSKGPGPPDLTGEKNHDIRTTDAAAVSGQNANLFQRRAGLEIKPVHNPACLKRKKEETAAAKYAIESSGGSGAGAASPIV